MPHRFGQDVRADDCWLTFLQSNLITHHERSQLLLAGFNPLAPAVVNVGSDDVDDGHVPDNLERLCDQLRSPPRRPVDWALLCGPARLLHRGELDYPPLLNQCQDAPPALFVVGELDALIHPAIAIVGSRTPSADGCRATGHLATTLAQAGIVVNSGLAKGIDGVAHQGALDGGGRTVAVMATGIDRIYPRRHRSLVSRIIGRGAVISEFPPGAEPQRWHFPRRNRTLSGLSLATVVVEAGSPSGSLITATAAAEQGRDVFAYPWSIYHQRGAGCRKLLSEGAQLACGPRDIIVGLGSILQAACELAPTTPSEYSKDEPCTSPNVKHHGLSEGPRMTKCTPAVAACGPHAEQLLAHLGDGECPLAQLMDLTGLPAAELRAQLSSMELAGIIAATTLGYRAIHRAQ